MTKATHLTRTLGELMRDDNLPTDWEVRIYDLHMLTQVPSWTACARASGSILDATHRTTILVTAGEVLAFQAMAGMYKTGMLLTEGGELDQNSVSFSHGWGHQLPRETIIRTIHHAGTKTKRKVSVIQNS